MIIIDAVWCEICFEAIGGAVMKCSNCGTEFEGAFCHECGARAEEQASASVAEPEAAYIKCKNCGAQYEGMFCPECGAKADSSAPFQMSDATDGSHIKSTVYTAARADKKQKITILIGAAVCAALIAAGFAGLWMIKKNRNAGPDVSEVQSTREAVSVTANADAVQSTPSATVLVQNSEAPTAAAAAGNAVSQRSTWSGSSEQYLQEYRLGSEQFTEEDTYQLSQTELRMLINALYAYHGYTFETDENKRLFGRTSWYSPQGKTMEECESEFNAVERANKDVFIAREKAMGWR